jgi:3-deoxy-D-manno-octulosonate 8-phosphate phosphatase (KDO 8-P phosphatase)
MIILDVDGVLTDGGMIYGSDASDYRVFDVYDGYGISRAIRSDLTVAIISRGKSDAVSARANALGIQEVHQGVTAKEDVFADLIKKYGIEPAQTCFMGDDEPDLPLLRLVGVGAAPSSAYYTVLREVEFITESPGGRGAVRELIDAILDAKKSTQ